MDIKHLHQTVDSLFSGRLTYMMLLQEIAENFYPERADFTIRRTHGNEFAADLMTSYPILTRRDLGDQIGQMLRPSSTEWFRMSPNGGEKADNVGRRWLEEMSRRQRQAMYARSAHFNRATKEGDHDFAAFGGCVISCRLNKNADNLLFRNYHIRDVVWEENDEGEIGLVARKWKPTVRELVQIFGGRTHEKVRKENEKKPFTKIDCYHFVVEADYYDKSAGGLPYWSIYYDAENQHIMEEIAVGDNEYRVPRWQTVSG
ncbi:MAG: portal protein, partial [Desulfobulbia bacterium]